MPAQQLAQRIEVPAALGPLIAVNIEHGVLLCVRPKCRKAVSPAGIVEHLRKIHKAEPESHGGRIRVRDRGG